MTKILLVEDDKSLREIYGVRLLAEGYDIVSAGDGEEALAMAIKERPDLIISDVMMPKISGFEMLDLLRSNESTKNIKVIVMTALSSESQRQRGEALGADRYLVKSQVGIEDVVRTVHEVLGDQNQAAAPAAPAPMQSPVNPPQATRPSSFAAPRPAAPQPPVQPVAQSQPPTATAQPEPLPTPQPVAAPSQMQPPPQGPQPATLPTPGFQSQQTTPNDPNTAAAMAQSGSMKSHKIEPTGETLNPKVDIDALLAKEEAKEAGLTAPQSQPTVTPAQDNPLPQAPIQTAPQQPVPEVTIDANGMIAAVPSAPPVQAAAPAMPQAPQPAAPTSIPLPPAPNNPPSAPPQPQPVANPFVQQPPQPPVAQ